MTSNRNSPQKGSDANEPDKNQSVESDAANVDWMIMSDFSTRIGGSIQPEKISKQESSQILDEDVEDLEWLRSLDLDDPIARSPSSKNASINQVSNDVESIDWLIVTDLKTRMDDSGIRAKANFKYVEESPKPNTTLQPYHQPDQFTGKTLDDSSLGLDGFEFLDSSDDFDFDFDNIDSLDLGTSDIGNSDIGNSGVDTSDSLNVNGLSDEIDIAEGKLLELDEFLADNFNLNNLDNNLNSVATDNDWDLGSEISENINYLFEESNEVPSQIAENASINGEINYGNEPLESNEYVNLDSDQSAETIYQESINDGDWEEYLIADPIDDLALSDEVVAVELIDDFSARNDLQDEQNNLADEKTNDLIEDMEVAVNSEFGQLNDLESPDSSVIGDEIWSSQSSLDSGSSDVFGDEAFANDWEKISVDSISANNDDAIWGGSPDINVEQTSSTSIDNAFGSLDDWAIAPQVTGLESSVSSDFDSFNFDSPNNESIEVSPQTFDPEGLQQGYDAPDDKLELDQSEDSKVDVESSDVESNYEDNKQELEIYEQHSDNKDSDDEDWSAGLDAEIGYSNDVDSGWQEQAIEVEEDFEVSSIENNIDLGSFEDDFVQDFEQDFSSKNSSQDLNESWELSDNLDDEDWAIANNSVSNLSDSVDNGLEFDEQSDYTDTYKISIAPSPTLELEEKTFAKTNDEELLDFSFIDEFTDNGANLSPTILDKQALPEAISSDNISNSSLDNNFDVNQNPKSTFNEDFDLDSFDTESFLEVPISDLNNSDLSNINIATTLTPIRIPSPVSGIPITSEVIPPSISNQSYENESIQSDQFFEEALANDLINESYAADYSLDVGLNEVALANDLLNGGYEHSVTNRLDNPIPKPPVHSSRPLPSFNEDSSDRNFLDDFDFDSLDVPLVEDFDSGALTTFPPSTISTGLIPPSAKAEPTSPTLNNPPPPFLPPLPPRRTPNQSKLPSPPTPPPMPKFQSQGKVDDFDSFHAQQEQILKNRNKNRQSISEIDHSWSELLDSDTVLSELSRSPSGYSPSDTSSGASHPSMGRSVGGAHTGGDPKRGSQSRDSASFNNNSKGVPKRDKSSKANTPHDFNELGLEIHDDSTGWSGLLDSDDISDNITTISSPGTQISSSRSRANQTRSSRLDRFDTNETKEIPRDRRNPVGSFGDTTQARMSAPPDQIDFNRFTEDSYGAYEPEQQPQVASPPIKPKITLPNISLESLWQDYLKIPAIGLGAIAGAFLFYSLLNKPVFDLGLRWGLFKDASGKDFTNNDFKGAKLDNVDFSKAILTGAKMQDASLVGANFQGANLDGVNFTKANLSRARLIEASVIWAEFSNAQMNLVDLEGANLTRSNFVSAKMEGANLKKSIIGAQGTEKATIFSPTVLLAWQIVNEPKEGRNLIDRNLSGLNLSFTSLKRANLSNSKLNYTDMTGTDLSGANLTGSQVNGANWSGAKLNGINLTEVAFDKSKLPKTDEETVCPNGKKGPCKF